jgi:hypothetical protein
MKLYRSHKYPARWIAFSIETGWVIFPPEVAGWTKRQPVRGINPVDIREVPLRMGFNTGIPGAPGIQAPDDFGAAVELGAAA